MKLYKYTEQQLRLAVAKSSSMRQVLIALNVASYGGNYDVLRKAIRIFEIDNSHFTGSAWCKGKILSPKRSLEDYVTNKQPISSHKLRLRLIKEGVFKPICSNCKNDSWLGNQIPLELDHIDGNNVNNELSNIRLLCPNCHSLTPTFRRRKS